MEGQLEKLQVPKAALKKLVDSAIKLGQDKTAEAQGIEASQLYSLRTPGYPSYTVDAIFFD